MSTAGTAVRLPWADRADSSCFGCSPDNPIGLGLRFHDDGVGGLVTDVRLDRLHESYPGVVHGGLLALVCDEAMGNLVVLRLGAAAVTTSLRLRYVGTVAPGVPHRCRATVVEGATGPAAPVRVRAEITDPDGAVVVTATASYRTAPPGTAAAASAPVPTPTDLRGDP